MKLSFSLLSCLLILSSGTTTAFAATSMTQSSTPLKALRSSATPGSVNSDGPSVLATPTASGVIPSSSGYCPLPKESGKEGARRKKAARSVRFGARGTLAKMTLYLAICRESAEEMIKAMEAGDLPKQRPWPTTFSWKGGVSLTPQRANAVIYGKTFEEPKCKKGLVILKTLLDMTLLNREAMVLGTNTPKGRLFSQIQNQIGDKLKKANKKGSSPEDIDTPVLCDDEERDYYERVDAVDVIMGSISLSDDEKAKVAQMNLPKMTEPFVQVVFVSDEGLVQGITDVKMEELETVTQNKPPSSSRRQHQK